MRAPMESEPGTDRARRAQEPALWPAVVAGLMAAVLVHVLMAPTSGVDTDPPVCWSYAGFEVPCDSNPWLPVALAAGVVVGIGVRAALRWKRS